MQSVFSQPPRLSTSRLRPLHASPRRSAKTLCIMRLYRTSTGTPIPTGPLIPLSAACGRNQVEGSCRPRAVSAQLSALSLAFSVQLLNQHREHAFDVDGLLCQLFIVIGRNELQISSE